jgi:hypothetical protein
MKRGKCLVVALAVASIAAFALPAASSVADETMVVVSRPGTVFHKAGSSDIRGRGHEKPLAEALDNGYAPCPVCYASEAKSGRISAPAPVFAGINAGRSGTSTVAALPAPGSGSSLPFGLRFGRAQGNHAPQGAGLDPYRDVSIVWNPGPEQGAYCCICPRCSK